MIEVISAGMYTSVQDAGRYGYRYCGVPLSGPMDKFHAQFANRLVGNDPEEALLEATLLGPKLRFQTTTEIAICGAQYEPKIDDVPVLMNRLITVETGRTLSLGSPSAGMRGYLAVKGGIKTQKVMGSRSMYVPITSRARIQKGDILALNENFIRANPSNASIKEVLAYSDSKILEVHEGPDYMSLPNEIKEQLQQVSLSVSSEGNRMGILLDGLEVKNISGIITAPVQPGTVQLTPSGKCIVLMRDAQTTGGYARVLQLSDSAMDCLAQKRPGALVSFRLIPNS